MAHRSSRHSRGQFSISAQLIQNPGFESPLSGQWEGVGFTLTRVHDARSGSSAIKASDRTSIHQGPGQIVNLKPGTLYNFTSYVKQLNDMPGKMFQKYRVNIGYTWRDDNHVTQQYVVQHNIVRSSDGWFRMAAIFKTPTRDFVMAKLRYQRPDIGIEFLVDDTSLVEIPFDPSWRQEADRRIQQVRMGDIHFNFNVASGLNAADFDVQIDHKKHEFRFGTLVQDRWMLDNNHKQYQDMVFDLFNTGTTQAVKWLFDRGSPSHPDFSQAIQCMDLMKERGMLVRAHNMFWGMEQYIPGHVLHLSGDSLKAAVEERLRYVVEITRGKADHWDIMNELEHGQWFEEHTHDPQYSEHLYKEVHQLDPTPLLMLNDYEVVGRAEITDAYVQQAQTFLADGVPLHGLGIQGHFHDEVPDGQLITLLLDQLSEVGLPLWVTEMDVWQADPNVRADFYETILRAFFAHSSVQGVVLWGFWDQHVVNVTSSLVDGANMHINAAGQRYIHLTKEEWSTHVNKSLSDATNFDVRGFKGEYEVIVRKNGVPVKTVTFSLTGSSATVNIDIDNVVEIPPPGWDHKQGGAGGYVMGTASSSTTQTGLTCSTKWGSTSDTADEAESETFCRNTDEILTGCSSILKNHDWHREGEQILTEQGQVICRAVDGFSTTAGIQPIARCCKTRGLTCTYRAAGPSRPGHGTTVEAQCASNEHLLACSSWGAHNNGGGVMATSTSSCRAVNNDLHNAHLSLCEGVYAYATCCSGASLSCVTVTSGVQHGNTAHAECDHGYTLTGCNFYTSSGRAAGAIMTGQAGCQAIASTGGGDVLAVARCCKVV